MPWPRDAMADPDNIYTLSVRDASSGPSWLQHDQHVWDHFANADAFMNDFSDPKRTVKEMKLPASVSSLHGLHFHGQRSLVVADLSSTSIEKILDGSFDHCTALKTVLFPDTLKEIGKRAFHSCVALNSVDLSTTRVSTIGAQSFRWSGSIRTILFPKTLEELGEDSFASCAALVGVDLSNTSVTVIHVDTFRDCISLESVRFPKVLENIGMRAFLRCNSLLGVDLSTTHVSTIGRGAFQGCSAMKFVLFPATLEEIGTESFARCTALEAVDLSVMDASRSSARLEDRPHALKIGGRAFRECDSLSELKLPARMISSKGDFIGPGAFSKCFQLEAFDVSGLMEMDRAPYKIFEPRPDGTDMVTAFKRETAAKDQALARVAAEYKNDPDKDSFFRVLTRPWF